MYIVIYKISETDLRKYKRITWNILLVINVSTCITIMENFILIAKYVIVQVKHFWRLASQYKRLHKPTHWSIVI